MQIHVIISTRRSTRYFNAARRETDIIATEKLCCDTDRATATIRPRKKVALFEDTHAREIFAFQRTPTSRDKVRAYLDRDEG